MRQEMLETGRISGTSEARRGFWSGKETRDFCTMKAEDGHENDARSEGCVWARARESFTGVFASS